MKRILALAGLGIVFSATSALADPFKDIDGNIHIQDALPSASLLIESGQLSRKLTANFCGLVLVSPPANASMPATVSVGGASTTVASLPVQSVPRCIDNILAESRSVNFKDTSGRVVVGKIPGVSYPVIYPGVPALAPFGQMPAAWHESATL